MDRHEGITTHAPVTVPPTGNTAENAKPSTPTFNPSQQVDVQTGNMAKNAEPNTSTSNPSQRVDAQTGNMAENAGASTSTSNPSQQVDVQTLTQKRYTHCKKMKLGYGCTARYVH